MSVSHRFVVQLLTALLVLGAAFFVRSAHLDWGLPVVEEEALPSKVAIQMWGFDDGTPDLDPGTAGWPALSFYVQRALQQVDYLAGRAAGTYSGSLDYYVEWLLDPSRVVLLGRWTSVVCGLVVCLVALLLGRAWAGPAGAALAGSLCAVSPLLVRHSQFVEPDALVTAFAALAMLWAWKIARSGRVRDYALAGIWIGLGTASKYTPILMALTLFIVHLERRRAEGLQNRALGLDDRRIGWAALAAVLSFCVVSPFTLADLDVLRRDFAYQALHMSDGHFGHQQEGLGYWHYLTSVLPAGIGWPALVAGLTGLGLSLRGPARERVALWTALPFLVVLGGLSTHFDRYMLPLVLPLALGCALTLRRAREGSPRWRAPVTVAGLLVLLASPVAGTLEHHRLLAAPSTQDLAADWLREHMDPEREVLATEAYGASLPYDRRAEFQGDAAFDRMDPDQRAALLAAPFVHTLHIPMYSVRTELVAYYYDLRNYLAYDWLVTSGAVRNRYLRDRERFPSQAAFYDLLDELVEPAWSVRSEGRSRGPALTVYRLDDRFRQEVLRRLGRRPVTHFASFTAELHAPHFLRFVETVGAHARYTGRWTEAAFWYEVLARAGVTRANRALGFEEAGKAYLRTASYPEAREMFEALEAYPERRMVAIANLGLIAEETGDLDRARNLYRQVIEENPGSLAGDWAQRRLADLEGP